MTKIFRKMRQKVLRQNKVSKYLLYATGEIILVVIGILIALQINNCSEQNKQDQKEFYYLNRLQADFKSNRLEANRNIALSNYQAKNAALLIKSLKEPLNQEESVSWFFALNHLWFLPHPNYTTSTWDELKSTGNLKLLSNKQLVKEITDFYSLLAVVNKYEDEWAHFNLEYRSRVNNVLNDSLRQSYLEIIDETGNFKLPKHAPRVDPYLKKLRAIEGIEGLISDIRINRSLAEELNHSQLKIQIENIDKRIQETLEVK